MRETITKAQEPHIFSIPQEMGKGVEMMNTWMKIIKMTVVIICLIAASVLTMTSRVSAQDQKSGSKHAPESAKELKNPLEPTETNISEGRELYVQNCAACHGPDGKAKTRMASSMTIKPTDLTSQQVHDLKAGEIFHIITHGIPESDMPDFGPTMSEQERWKTVLFVQKLSKPEGEKSSGSRR